MEIIFQYIDTGSPVLNIPSKSRGLADENKIFDGMEMIQNIRIVFLVCNFKYCHFFHGIIRKKQFYFKV